MEGGENYRVQQGAGMAVAKSDEEYEYASTVFLKWFTQKEQNLKFVCESAYMPVLKESNNIKALDQIIKEEKIDMNNKAYDCLKTVLRDFDNTKFYTTKSFENGYSMRKILDYNLKDRVTADKTGMDEAIAAGASREEELEKYISEEFVEYNKKQELKRMKQL